MKNHNKKWHSQFKQISVGLILVMIVVSSFLLVQFAPSKASPIEDNVADTLAAAMPEQTSQETQMLKNLPQDAKFEIISEQTITNENLNDSLKLLLTQSHFHCTNFSNNLCIWFEKSYNRRQYTVLN
jgi:hypothetical protein